MLLYIDCAAGLSGDMLLAAWLDMGLPLGKLQRVLRQLGLLRISVEVRRIQRAGVSATRLQVQSENKNLFFPRQAEELLQWINRSRLDPPLKQKLLRTVTLLAQAEGKVHGVPWRRVAFHQLAEVDTLVSLVGFSVGLAHFHVGTVYSSAIPIGSVYQDPHGRWRPHPGPAVQLLLRRFPTYTREERFEWSTPTGAILLESFGSSKRPPPFRVERIGYGAGNGKAPGSVGALRMLLGAPRRVR